MSLTTRFFALEFLSRNPGWSVGIAGMTICCRFHSNSICVHFPRRFVMLCPSGVRYSSAAPPRINAACGRTAASIPYSLPLQACHSSGFVLGAPGGRHPTVFAMK